MEKEISGIKELEMDHIAFGDLFLEGVVLLDHQLL
jgi:hypothetical protein